MVEDVDGNVFLDCAAGIAVNSTGHSHPDVVAAIVEQAESLPAHVGHRLLLRAAGAARGGALGDCADAWPVPVVLRQLRRGGQRGGDQAGALSLEAPVPDRVHGLVPRPHARRAVAHREPRRAAQGLRAGDRARGVPRAVSRRLSRRPRRGGAVARVPRGQDLRAPGRARGSRGDRRRADPGRGRVPRAAARVPAATPRDRGSTRHPADRRRGAGRHGPHGPHVRDRVQRRAARHHHDGQGHCLGHAARRGDGPGRPHGLDARRAREHVRRQSGRVCRGTDDDPAAARAADRQCRRRRRHSCSTGCARCRRNTT